MPTQDDVKQKLDDATDIDIAVAHIKTDDPVSKEAAFRLQQQANELRKDAEKIEEEVKVQDQTTE